MFVDLSPLMCPKLTSWFSRYSSFLIVGTPSFQWLIQIPIVMLDFSRALIFFTQFISESCWLCLQKKHLESNQSELFPLPPPWSKPPSSRSCFSFAPSRLESSQQPEGSHETLVASCPTVPRTLQWLLSLLWESRGPESSPQTLPAEI